METYTKHIRATPTTWHKLKKTADANNTQIGSILEEIMTGKRNPVSMRLKTKVS